MTHTSCIVVLCVALFGPGVLFMLWWVVKHLRDGGVSGAGMHNLETELTSPVYDESPVGKPLGGWPTVPDSRSIGLTAPDKASALGLDAIPKNVREQLRRDSNEWTRL